MAEHAGGWRGGPTGLMLAGELALAGIDVVIVEPRTSQQVDGSRAGGFSARSRCSIGGVAVGSCPEGRCIGCRASPGTCWTSATSPLAITTALRFGRASSSPSLPNGFPAGVPMLRGCKVVGFAQDDTGVDVDLSVNRSLRAEFLVGCDGGRSLIRQGQRGIDFVGFDPSRSWIIAEVELAEEPEFGLREGGGIGRAADEEASAGGTDRRAPRAHQRAHPAGSRRGTHRGRRDRLRGGQPDLDLQVHRHVAAGSTATAAYRGRGRRTRAPPARAVRASTPACRTP